MCNQCGCFPECCKPDITQANLVDSLEYLAGIGPNGCFVYSSLAGLFDPCLIYGNVPAGEIESVTGKDAEGCAVMEDDETFVRRNESPWDGESPLGTIIITQDGAGSPNNGHTPLLDVVLAPAQGGIPNITTIVPGEGLYTPVGAGIRPEDTTTVDMSWDPVTGVLTADVIFCSDGADVNQASDCGTGVYVPRGADANTTGVVQGNGSTADPITLDFSNMSAQDLCDFGGTIPAGTVTAFIGHDSSNCLVTEGIEDVMCREIASFNTGGPLPNGQQILGDDCRLYTYVEFDHCAALAALPLGGELQDGQVVVGSDCRVYTYRDLCAQVAARPYAGQLTTGIRLLSSDCSIYEYQAPPAVCDVLATTFVLGDLQDGQELIGRDCGAYIYRAFDLCASLGNLSVAGPVADGQLLVGRDCQVYTYNEPVPFDLCAALQTLPLQPMPRTTVELVSDECIKYSFNWCQLVASTPVAGTAPAGMAFLGTDCNAYTLPPAPTFDLCAEITALPLGGEMTEGTIFVGADCERHPFSFCSLISGLPNAGQIQDGDSVVTGSCETKVWRDVCSQLGALPDGGVLADGQSIVGADCQTYTFQEAPAFDICAAIGAMAIGGDLPNGVRVVGEDCTLYTITIPPAVDAPEDLVAVDSSTIDFTTSGAQDHTITGVVRTSADPCNAIEVRGDGLYVENDYNFQLVVNPVVGSPVATIGQFGDRVAPVDDQLLNGVITVNNPDPCNPMDFIINGDVAVVIDNGTDLDTPVADWDRSVILVEVDLGGGFESIIGKQSSRQNNTAGQREGENVQGWTLRKPFTVPAGGTLNLNWRMRFLVINGESAGLTYWAPNFAIWGVNSQ